MKCAAVHLAFNYAEAWAAGNSSTAASVFAGASERHLFPLTAPFLNKCLLSNPHPNLEHIYQIEGAFKRLLVLYGKERLKSPAPNLTATLGNALTALPQSKSVNPRRMHRTPHLSCWTVKSPKRMVGKETFQMHCLPHEGAGDREGLGKPRVQSCLCLSPFLLLGVSSALNPAGKSLLGIKAGLRHKILIIWMVFVFIALFFF